MRRGLNNASTWSAEDRRFRHVGRLAPEVGHGLSELPHPSRGLAVLPGPTRERTRIFLCDPVKKQIRILNGAGLVVGAFGGTVGPAALSWPADLLLVRPEFSGERYDHDSAAATWLVVADRVLQRIQVYETDGTFVGSIGDDRPRPHEAPEGSGDRPGWPFFGLTALPRIGAPVGLTWRAPSLEITTAEGELVAVDLAYGLLPTFERWLATAGCGELFAARRFFRPRPRARVIGLERQLAIDTALGCRLLDAKQFGQATSVWEADLPTTTADAGFLRRAVQDRLSAVTSCAFRMGHYGPLAATAAPLRAQLAALSGGGSADATASSSRRLADGFQLSL